MNRTSFFRKRYKVFISYRRKDSAILADLLKTRLRSWRIWAYVDVDENDGIGKFPDRLKKAIEDNDVFLCLLAESTLESEWVQFEIKYALELKKPCIPVFQELYKNSLPSTPAEIEEFLAFDGVPIYDRKHQYIDSAVEKLALLIRAKPINRRHVSLSFGIKAMLVVATIIFIAALVGFLVYFAPVFLTAKPQLEWVAVNDGQFMMGSEAGADNAKPTHFVHLPTFQMSEFEITNGNYAQCVKARQCNIPESLHYEEPGFGNHPVVGVNWYNARAFCIWVGGRLPTEAEWEKAATWDAENNRKYVWTWGNTWQPTYLNSLEGGMRTTVEVGLYPNGASPYGVMDMAGNAWEWTNSLLKPYPYDGSDGREASNVSDQPRVVRGGSWANVDDVARSANRSPFFPETRSQDIGFRCAT